jgi:hypothetical protein
LFLCRHDEQYISPRQIALQILGKLCINETNVDWILFDLPIEQQYALGHALLYQMNTYDNNIIREYCLTIVCSLCKRNRTFLHFFHAHRMCIEFIFNYLEFYEYTQQQYLLATLTACCYSTSSTSLTMPVNDSHDMMIDSCIQLFILFASIQGNNRLRSFESRLIDMSSSIYFEQRFLQAFADILYHLRT